MNYIPLHGGRESLFHFVLRCLFSKAVYEKNIELREKSSQVLVEGEKEFFENKKFRGDVFDPFTKVLYEIQRDWREIRKKKRIFYKCEEIELIKFINPEGFTDSEEFEEFLWEDGSNEELD